MHCANCGATLGNLENAHAWLGRPACQRCFKHLSVDRHPKERRFWMPLAIGLGAVAAAQGIALAVLLSRPAGAAEAATPVPAQAPAVVSPAIPARADKVTSPPPAAAEPPAADRGPTVPPARDAAPLPAAAPPAEAAAAAGPSRSDIVAMLRAERPWYWHYEQADRNNPFHFAVDGNGGIRTVGEGGKPVTLEQRWVLSLGGHYFIPVDDHTLRGFHVSSGRQVGAFTD